MAISSATINYAPGQSTDYTMIHWSSFTSGANNITVDVDHVDASKMLILVAAPSTVAAAGLWIGTSDSRASHTSMHYPYSASKLGRMMVFTTVQSTGTHTVLKSSKAADTELYSIYAVGPVETARFKDSDGYINICRRRAAGIDSLPCYLATIMIP